MSPAPQPSALLLGVDGGGTSTEAWLSTPGGDVFGKGRAGASNVKAVGLTASQQAIDSAIEEAFRDAGIARTPVDVACLGMAGFDRPDDRRLLGEWSDHRGWARRLVLVNDGDLVVAAGTPDGWGIGVIAGTGSIAVGRAPDGRKARAGGWGPLIGDEGSAYHVALNALRMVARRADGRESSPTTDALTTHMCNALGVSGPGSIVSALYSPGVDRSRIASLAPAVILAARDEPGIVDTLLRPAGVSLADQVMAVARALGWLPGDKLPLAMAGGFLLAADEVRRSLLDTLEACRFEVTATPVVDPVRGAVTLATREWSIPGLSPTSAETHEQRPKRCH